PDQSQELRFRVAQVVTRAADRNGLTFAAVGQSEVARCVPGTVCDRRSGLASAVVFAVLRTVRRAPVGVATAAGHASLLLAGALREVVGDGLGRQQVMLD